MFPCEIQEHATRHTLAIRFKAPVQELPVQFERVYTTIMEYLGELGAQPAGPPFAIYYNMDMQNLDVEAGFPVAEALPGKREIQAGEIAKGRFAVCHYTGPYDQVGPAYQTLTEFAEANGLKPNGAPSEWYLNGPEEDPQNLKTDLVFPVEPA